MQVQSDFDPKTILFFDIETAPIFKTKEEMPEELRAIYLEKPAKKKKKKIKQKAIEEEESEEACHPPDEEDLYGGTGLCAEFGKVICISVGKYNGEVSDENLEICSFTAETEIQLLKDFSEFLSNHPVHRLCAHNGNNFDLPFLIRRYLINRLSLPPHLNLKGKKPWEIPHIDTMELWSFSARPPQKTTLKLLCAVFGIPSPKDDIDGSQVARVYYSDGDLKRIAIYCEKDVRVLAKIFNFLTAD